jgi:protein-tyrosine-phosphatase
MSQQELLKKVVEVLGNLGIDYMVSGSIASSLQGEPRSTHDIDIVVAIRQSSAKTLAAAFPAPEDTILTKLRWAKESGGSEKHFGDALRVYEVQHGSLDVSYLKSWARKLVVSPMLQRIEEQAEPL